MNIKILKRLRKEASRYSYTKEGEYQYRGKWILWGTTRTYDKFSTPLTAHDTKEEVEKALVVHRCRFINVRVYNLKREKKKKINLK